MHTALENESQTEITNSIIQPGMTQIQTAHLRWTLFLKVPNLLPAWLCPRVSRHPNLQCLIPYLWGIDIHKSPSCDMNKRVPASKMDFQDSPFNRRRAAWRVASGALGVGGRLICFLSFWKAMARSFQHYIWWSASNLQLRSVVLMNLTASLTWELHHWRLRRWG